MKTQSCKAKGRKLCKEIALKLYEKFNWKIGEIHVTSSGCGGEDLKLSPLARERFPYSMEMKNVEQLNIWAALDQCEDNSGDYIPLLVFRRNRSKTYAVVEFDYFLELFKNESKDEL